MIRKENIYTCLGCGGPNIVKNGRNRYGNQQYRSKYCQKSGLLNPKNSYTEAQKEHILAAYRERPSMRGISRLCGISRNTLVRWLNKVKTQPELKKTLLPAQADDVLELDELCSFVRLRKNKRWLWTVLCRRTRQIISFTIGDHSEKTCQKLWRRITVSYRGCHSFSDF